MVFLFGLLAALLLAVGYVLQQHEAAEITNARLSPALLLRLVRRPIWIGGIFAMIGGQLLGATALGFGSLVLVEPLLALNVLFALPLAAVSSRRWLSRGDWLGAIMLVAGLAVFLAGMGGQDSDVTQANPTALTWILSGGAIVALLAIVITAARRSSGRVQAALVATGAGCVFGMQDFLTQRTLVRLNGGVLHLLLSWHPWALLVAAVVGLTFSQRAFGMADLSASLPPITLAEPVCGIALSIFALNQAFPSSPLPLFLAVAGLALMISGVAVLTRSPLVVDPHGKKRRDLLHIPHPHLHGRRAGGRGATALSHLPQPDRPTTAGCAQCAQREADPESDQAVAGASAETHRQS